MALYTIKRKEEEVINSKQKQVLHTNIIIHLKYKDMKLKIKGICVDINRPESLNDLKRLKNVCKTELEETQIEKSRREFLSMIVNMIDNKLEKTFELC